MKNALRGGLTDIKGIRIGHMTNKAAMTGCTVILCPPGGAVAGVDVRGSAPGTRETDLLRGYNSVEAVHAILLTGGSAYGLDAASGVMQALEKEGVGVDVGVGVVPIVPAAVLFDLAVGSSDIRPAKKDGELAVREASKDAILKGAVGAGTGATVGKAYGKQYAHKSGIGSCCIDMGDGVLIAALAAVNALGDIYDHKTGELLAAARIDGKLRACEPALIGKPPFAGTNTTIGIIATNASLNREQANKLASMAHDGLAMSIRPVHTDYDGDTIFALSTKEHRISSLLSLFACAAEVMACAVEDAIKASKR